MDKLYSVKMRASEGEKHISGAEKIVSEENLEVCISGLMKRAQTHPKGTPDFINIKVEKINKNEIKVLKPLKVTAIASKDKEEGWLVIEDILSKLGIENGQDILNNFQYTFNMRGAMLLDIKTMMRLEPDKNRGIRATNMDFEDMNVEGLNKEIGSNIHFKEALVLATKVVSHPNILAEICVSDDHEYTTGYIASKEFGYVRITNLKELGDERGGRIFLFKGSEEQVQECIDYIQRKYVLIKNNIEIN
ncbi:MAG: 6-carboxyhexanoate--CoA ligase [Clostridium sp.]